MKRTLICLLVYIWLITSCSVNQEPFSRKGIVQVFKTWQRGCLFQEGHDGTGGVVFITNPFRDQDALINIRGKIINLALVSKNLPNDVLKRDNLIFKQEFANHNAKVRVTYSNFWSGQNHAFKMTTFSAIIFVKYGNSIEEVITLGRCGG